MKRIVSVFLVLAIVISFSACGNTEMEQSKVEGLSGSIYAKGIGLVDDISSEEYSKAIKLEINAVFKEDPPKILSPDDMDTIIQSEMCKKFIEDLNAISESLTSEEKDFQELILIYWSMIVEEAFAEGGITWFQINAAYVLGGAINESENALTETKYSIKNTLLTATNIAQIRELLILKTATIVDSFDIENTSSQINPQDNALLTPDDIEVQKLTENDISDILNFTRSTLDPLTEIFLNYSLTFEEKNQRIYLMWYPDMIDESDPNFHTDEYMATAKDLEQAFIGFGNQIIEGINIKYPDNDVFISLCAFSLEPVAYIWMWSSDLGVIVNNLYPNDKLLSTSPNSSPATSSPSSSSKPASNSDTLKSGEYWCLGKNNTCKNKTTSATDLYCSTCDPNGDNVEG